VRHDVAQLLGVTNFEGNTPSANLCHGPTPINRTPLELDQYFRRSEVKKNRYKKTNMHFENRKVPVLEDMKALQDCNMDTPVPAHVLTGTRVCRLVAFGAIILLSYLDPGSEGIGKSICGPAMKEWLQ
jgi:hypothetical protein